ncbi:MAG TPA: alpha/beta hydrolase [Gemmatimonadota bacterium]|nr:alpha/beta hydrolase [Gemmatimonadota bacterium]
MTPSGGAGPEVRHVEVDAGDVALHCAVAGDPARGLVVFLHGFPEIGYAWRRLLADLGADHLVAAPDQRGYGLSDKPADVETYRIDRLVADVAAVADHFGKERFALVGHDWGGVVAWAFAAARPERLEKLVVVNAPHPALFARRLAADPAQQKASAYMELLRSPEAEKVLAADGFALLDGPILQRGVAEGWLTETDRAAYREAWSRPGALTGMVNWYRAAGLSAAGREPPAVEVPTLVIWGTGDRYLLPGNADDIEAAIPAARVRRVDDADHWVVHQRPALVGGWIREFLAA